MFPQRARSRLRLARLPLATPLRTTPLAPVAAAPQRLQRARGDGGVGARERGQRIFVLAGEWRPAQPLEQRGLHLWRRDADLEVVQPGPSAVEVRRPQRDAERVFRAILA